MIIFEVMTDGHSPIPLIDSAHPVGWAEGKESSREKSDGGNRVDIVDKVEGVTGVRKGEKKERRRMEEEWNEKEEW